jgi:hypothetical protein
VNEIIKLDAIPTLDDYVPASVDLSGEYWTPEEGETKRLIFWSVEQRTVPDQKDANKLVDLQCCVFIDPQASGQHKTLANGSKRLVAAFENTEMQQGTPVQITYVGKKRNRTNANLSDHWSVFVLKKKGN